MSEFPLSSLSEFGVTALILLMTIYGIWRIVIPSVLKQWEETEKNRIESNQQIAEYYRNEIKSAREELREDKHKLIQAFTDNTRAINHMNDTLTDLTKQITDVTVETKDLKRDIAQVYRILGEKRSLIEREKGVS
jgi:uncharacterized coiled-coil DUF342 family protein